jgi:23S rRNA pseudouridine2605 synthase
MSESPAPRVRLQKFLSDAGVASRRHAEELIVAGRVLVNDAITDTLPVFVDPEHDRVIVDGALVRPQRLDYFIMHKPKGVVCTNRDPAGRLRAVDLLPPLGVRLFVVGRLDEDSTGLLLLTNDGELAERITHPRYGMSKLYEVHVRGHAAGDLPERMRRGVYFAEGKASAEQVQIVRSARDESVLHVTLAESRNRQVRRMLARLGHAVKTLKRLQIGPLTLKGLPIGACRRLSSAEIEELRRAASSVRPPSLTGREKPPRRRAERTAVAVPTGARPQGDGARRGGKPIGAGRPAARRGAAARPGAPHGDAARRHGTQPGVGRPQTGGKRRPPRGGEDRPKRRLIGD